jgi:hypothetical protein
VDLDPSTTVPGHRTRQTCCPGPDPLWIRPSARRPRATRRGGRARTPVARRLRALPGRQPAETTGLRHATCRGPVALWSGRRSNSPGPPGEPPDRRKAPRRWHRPRPAEPLLTDRPVPASAEQRLDVREGVGRVDRRVWTEGEGTGRQPLPAPALARTPQPGRHPTRPCPGAAGGRLAAAAAAGFRPSGARRG